MILERETAGTATVIAGADGVADRGNPVAHGLMAAHALGPIPGAPPADVDEGALAPAD